MAWTSKIINVTEIKKQCLACSGTQWSSYEIYGKIPIYEDKLGLFDWNLCSIKMYLIKIPLIIINLTI